MSSEKRSQRQAQQDSEVEESNAAMRKSIDETHRLMSASEEMLKRHRREREEDGAEGQPLPQ